jgi:hypothetical protein
MGAFPAALLLLLSLVEANTRDAHIGRKFASYMPRVVGAVAPEDSSLHDAQIDLIRGSPRSGHDHPL